MEISHARAEAARVTAHFIQAREACVTIERRVLDSFGHDRPGQLLEAQDKIILQVSATAKQEQFLQKLKQINRKIPAMVAGPRGRRMNETGVALADFGIIPATDIGSIDGDASCQLSPSVAQLIASEIPALPMARGYVNQQLG